MFSPNLTSPYEILSDEESTRLKHEATSGQREQNRYVTQRPSSKKGDQADSDQIRLSVLECGDLI